MGVVMVNGTQVIRNGEFDRAARPGPEGARARPARRVKAGWNAVSA